MVVQPVLRVCGDSTELHSVELLARGPRGTNLERADVLFAYARRKCAEISIDRACFAAGFAAVAQIPFAPRFSVNVHALTLGHDQGFVEFIVEMASTYGIDLSLVTIEIIETSTYWDRPAFRAALAGLRSLGISIALDDVGLGYSNYRMIIETLPEYFKIDSYLIQGIHACRHRQSILRSIQTLAHEFSGQVIAEGVEDRNDCDTVVTLGVDLIQGYLFFRPMTIDQFNQAFPVNSQAASTVVSRNSVE